MPLVGELFHAIHLHCELLVCHEQPQPQQARAEHQDGRGTHSNPHCSPHCSEQDDLQTSNGNEEDELYARSGATPGKQERQEQLIALDSNSPKTCPVCRHPFPSTALDLTVQASK